MSHVLRWERAEHPIIGELREHQGYWGVIAEAGVSSAPDYFEVRAACAKHPRVEVEVAHSPQGSVKRARWIPDTEWCCCRRSR